MRPADPADAQRLWEWANDPLVRRWAFAQGAIPWETHQAWFASRIADPNTRIFLGFDGTMPIGQVRFEGDDHAVEISVSVAERARGRGFGAAIVDAAVRRLFGESGVDRVVARLRHGNTASEKLFEAASFDSEGEGSDGPLTWVQYARSRDAESP